VSASEPLKHLIRKLATPKMLKMCISREKLQEMRSRSSEFLEKVMKFFPKTNFLQQIFSSFPNILRIQSRNDQHHKSQQLSTCSNKGNPFFPRKNFTISDMSQAPTLKIIHTKRVNNLQSVRNKSSSKQLHFEKFFSQGIFFPDFVNVLRLQSKKEKHKKSQKRAKWKKNNVKYFWIYFKFF